MYYKGYILLLLVSCFFLHIQLKNMIAALHSSRPGGTKNFAIDGCNFGWKALEDLFLREVERARTNQLRRVKDLKESHIYRDCWTRLNVKPAKIMQVRISQYCLGHAASIFCTHSKNM